MLNTFAVDHGNAMRAIIAHLNGGRKIEAIKACRILYGVGLKEAKDAVEAIADALGFARPVAQADAQFVVLHRYSDTDELGMYRTTNKSDALQEANEIVNNRSEVIVAQVIAQSITTRSMRVA